MLTAFQQVEDNLAAVRILENEAKVQNDAVVAAQRSLDLSFTRYKGGVTSYLEVITARSASLADEVTAVNILGRRMANTVSLIPQVLCVRFHRKCSNPTALENDLKRSMVICR